MLAYTLMQYDYEQTDIYLATHDIKEVSNYIEENGDDFRVMVWENGERIEVFLDKDDNKWKSSWKEDVLDEDELKLLNKFLSEVETD